MNLTGLPKDVRAELRKLLRDGYVARWHGSLHLRLRHVASGMEETFPGTPREPHRAVARLRSFVRKCEKA
jgi:hypothetical protein